MIRQLFKPYRIIAYFLCLVIALGFAGQNSRVFAIPDPVFYSGNDIIYYDPDFQTTCAEGGGGLAGGSTKEKIWNFLIANDLTPEQAAGLMANMQVESGFIPIRYQSDRDFNPWTPNKKTGEGKAWGLVQWDGGRRLAILNTIKDQKSHLAKYIEHEYNGIAEPNEKFPEDDFDEMLLFQLDYMMQESIGRPVTAHGFSGSADKEWARMKEQPDAAEATKFWERNFEVAGRPNILQRIGFSRDILNEFGSNTTAAGSGTSGCANADSIQELALAYAWPEAHAPNYPNKKPAYEEAIQKADSEGRFVGGGRYPGVDCGGFVTNLVVNSGYDPNYNHGGESGAGDTTTQRQWLQDNWQFVGRGGDPGLDKKLANAGVAVAIFRPGNTGHTFIYIDGLEELGFGGEGTGGNPGIVSASYGEGVDFPAWRAPMAGTESTQNKAFDWYIKK